MGDGLTDEGVGVRHSGAILGCALGASQRSGQNARLCSGSQDVRDNFLDFWISGVRPLFPLTWTGQGKFIGVCGIP